MQSPSRLFVTILFFVSIVTTTAEVEKTMKETVVDSSSSFLSLSSSKSYCNVTTVLAIALNQTVAYLSPDATAITCVDTYYPLLSSTEILISAMALAPSDPTYASTVLMDLFTRTVNDDGSLSLYFLSSDYPPQPVNCPNMWPPVYLWNNTLITNRPEQENTPCSSSTSSSSRSKLSLTDQSLSFLLATPLHATAVIETFWSLYRNTSGISGTGSTAAINFLSSTWNYLYNYYEYIYSNRIINIDSNDLASKGPPNGYTNSLYFTIHPWENLYPANIVWRTILEKHGTELGSTCTTLPPPSPSPLLVQLLPNYQNESNYRNEWCLMICLLASNCRTSLQLINVLDNAILALGTEHLTQISEWLKSAQIGTVPGIDPNTANVLTNDQSTVVQNWRSSVSQTMLTILYTNLPIPSTAGTSTTTTTAVNEPVQDDDNNNNGYGWGYDLLIINNTVQSIDTYLNTTLSSLTDILSLSSISLLLANPNPLRQGYVSPSNIVPYNEPTSWRMNILNRLLSPDFFDYPLLPTLSRYSKNYSSSGSSEGCVSILMNAWTLSSIQESIYITNQGTGLPPSNLDTIATYIRTNSRQMVCDQIIYGLTNNNNKDNILPGTFDSRTGQSLLNITGIALFFPAYISRIFQPPVQPIDPPPAYQGVAYLITILVTELIIVLVAAIFCVFVGIRVVLERRKLFFQKQQYNGSISSSNGTDYTLLPHTNVYPNSDTLNHGTPHTLLSINGSINGSTITTNYPPPYTPVESSVHPTNPPTFFGSSVLKTPHTENEFFSPLSHSSLWNGITHHDSSPISGLSSEGNENNDGYRSTGASGKKSRSVRKNGTRTTNLSPDTVIESGTEATSSSVLLSPSSPNSNTSTGTTHLSSAPSPAPSNSEKPGVIGSFVSNAWWAVTSVVSLPVSMVTTSSRPSTVHE